MANVSFAPGTNSPDSPLSTPPSDLESFHELNRQVSARLLEYTPRDKDDDTVSLLKLFLRYLPRDGEQVLMHDILDQEDDILLRQLRSDLVDTLLKPCKLLITEVYLMPC